MLILTRRTGESLHIGEDIELTVLRIKGNQVRIGIKAPRSTSVRREELSAQQAEALGAPLAESTAHTGG